MSDDEGILLSDLVDCIMRMTGCTRRQATRKLIDGIRAGKIPLRGINSETGEMENIDPAALRNARCRELDSH